MSEPTNETKAVNLLALGAAFRGVADVMRERPLSSPAAFALIRRVLHKLGGSTEIPGEVYTELQRAGNLPAGPELAEKFMREEAERCTAQARALWPEGWPA